MIMNPMDNELLQHSFYSDVAGRYLLVIRVVKGECLIERKQMLRAVASGERREPPRVCRRPFGLSYAAMAGCSSMA
jgi:hypothetical protein